MTIVLKNKETLHFKEFKFKCCIGKNGLTKNKIEGDKKSKSMFLEEPLDLADAEIAPSILFNR